jgi:hypothetical protein
MRLSPAERNDSPAERGGDPLHDVAVGHRDPNER